MNWFKSKDDASKEFDLDVFDAVNSVDELEPAIGAADDGQYDDGSYDEELYDDGPYVDPPDDAFSAFSDEDEE